MPTRFMSPLPGGHRAFIIVLSLPAAALLTVSALLTSIAGPDSTSIAARAASYFSADGEANLWSWYTGLILTFIGIAFALLSLSATTTATRRAYRALALVGFYLSADEIASLHELLFQPAAAVGLGGAGWLAFGIPLVLVAGAALLIVARAIDRALRRRLILAGACFLVGAVGLEAVNEFLLESLDLRPWSPLYLFETTVEEGLEFVGTLLALTGAVSALERTARARVLDAFPAPAQPAAVPRLD